MVVVRKSKKNDISKACRRRERGQNSVKEFWSRIFITGDLLGIRGHELDSNIKTDTMKMLQDRIDWIHPAQ
jgi:hypothetical protein